MPPRKAEQIVQFLRNEILSGQRAPGAKLPTYDAFIEQFGVTRPTVARGLKALRSEGLVTADGTRGVFVAKTFPHHSRYLWVTSEQPGSPGWTSFLATTLELIERGETGIPGEVIPLLGVDGRANNPAYQTLCDAVEHGSAAGLLLMNSATTHLLPVLQTPGLPRVAIGAPLPHAELLGLDVSALIERACARVLKKGRRLAVFSPDACNLERARESLLRRGVDRKLLTVLHVAPVGCETLTELLFERPDRPDAVFVTDDSLVRPLLVGLGRAKVRPGRDVHVLAHCNWPRPIGATEGIEHIGFDVRELLSAAKEYFDARRDGEDSPGGVVPPRFANEILPAKSPLRWSSAA
jgi:Bacterial regulatory proteins, gntR family